MTITKVKFANEQDLETGWIYIERPDLTDEEIKQVWSGVKWNGSDPIELTFARAILRKAQ